MGENSLPQTLGLMQIFISSKTSKTNHFQIRGDGGLAKHFSQLRQTFGKHSPIRPIPLLIFLNHVETFPNLSSAVTSRPFLEAPHIT